MTRQAQSDIRRHLRRPAAVAPAALVAGLLAALFTGSPVAVAGLLPSLPVSLPSLQLPSLPIVLPSLPLPSLPRPSLPVPTIAPPTLPVPTAPSTPAPSNPGQSPGATSTPPVSGSAPLGSPAPSALGPSSSPDTAEPAPSSDLGGGPGPVGGPIDGDQSGGPFGFALPILIAGIPLALIGLIVILQLAGGAVWLPVIKRWLNRRLTPDA